MPQQKKNTSDKEQAFRYLEEIAEILNVKTYFARPYTSQGKSTVENRDGVIRMFFSNKTDFNLISNSEVKRLEKIINNLPVQKFSYLSTNKVLPRLNGSVALMG